MLRGIKNVTCPHCEHKFLAADIEDNATTNTMAVHCPKCGNVVKIARTGIMDTLRKLLEALDKLSTKNEDWI
jgi:DNA-directed RNA polymerase subunit RPC12/RpoP